jgi:hypothetical protein
VWFSLSVTQLLMPLSAEIYDILVDKLNESEKFILIGVLNNHNALLLLHF